MTVVAREVFGHHDFGNFKVDVFGYDPKTNRYTYSVKCWCCFYVRETKAHYKGPDKRNEWAFPFGTYIYITDPNGRKHRIQADYRP